MKKLLLLLLLIPLQVGAIDPLYLKLNSIRAHYGLSIAYPDTNIERAASLRAKYIYEFDDFAHMTKDGKKFYEWADVPFKYWAENLARKFNDDHTLTLAWLDSPTHKQIILSPNCKQMGIGRNEDVVVLICAWL